MTRELSIKYPDYVFIKISTSSKKDITIKKEKYMVHRDITMHKFLISLRCDKYVKLRSQQNLTPFIDNIIPRLTDCLGTIYDRHQKEDGILYVCIETENVFG